MGHSADHLVAATNFLVPNLTFVVELVIFLLLLAILAKYVLPRLNVAMSARQSTLRQALEDADTAKRRAEEAETDYKKAMDQARNEARSMVEEANRSGEQLRVSARQRGEDEAQRIIVNAHNEVDAAVKRATEKLRGDVTAMVIDVVHKVVGEGFSTDDHRDLIERTISQVESEAASAPELHANDQSQAGV